MALHHRLARSDGLTSQHSQFAWVGGVGQRSRMDSGVTSVSPTPLSGGAPNDRSAITSMAEIFMVNSPPTFSAHATRGRSTARATLWVNSPRVTP